MTKKKVYLLADGHNGESVEIDTKEASAMCMKIEGDMVVFSSGRTRGASCGIIGLAPNMEVSEGYDGGFYSGADGEDWKDEGDELTKQDLVELADYMIEQWGKFRSLYT